MHYTTSMSVHWRNELVDGQRGAVVEEGGERFYCYAAETKTLKDGSKFQPRVFLSVRPVQSPNQYIFIELEYGTQVVKKGSTFVVVNK